MPLYHYNQSKLTPLSEKPFKLEKELQTLTEENLDELFSLKFISTEFQLNNLRIDTLAFDPETNTFVIIEYKRGSSFSIVDQGYAYLALLLNNKADFILEYNENMKDNLKRDQVDWSQSRVIFVAKNFTNYQRNAINFKHLPIELWEVKRYENNSILYNHLKPTESRESIKTISGNKTIEAVSKEIHSITRDDHFKQNWTHSKEIYEELVEKLMELEPRFIEVATKPYIAFKIEKKNILQIKPYKTKVRLEFNKSEPKDFRDPEKKVKIHPQSMKYYNQWISYIDLENIEDNDYAIFLTKQAIKNYT